MLFLNVSVIMQGYMMIKFSVAFQFLKVFYALHSQSFPPETLAFFVGVWSINLTAFHTLQEKKNLLLE